MADTNNISDTAVEKTTNTVQEARRSFTGKTLTNSQLEESWALAGIIHHNIKKTGSFTEKLTDYSHAYARLERIDAMKGETIIRDIFKSRYGKTMNQMREGLMERENNLPKNAKTKALEQAKQIDPLISNGETMPFYRAYDEAGHSLAASLDITEAGAKELMKSSFRETEGKELYDWGKALEKAHHEPAREAYRRQNNKERNPARSRKRS